MATLLRKRTATTLLLVAAAGVAMAGCQDEMLAPPDPPEDDLFARYVALGNSLTAGVQSDGINENTQRQSYAYLLAGQMGTPFDIPRLQNPGCPPPLTNPLTGERVGGPEASLCSLRGTPPPRVIHNVAVPAAGVFDPLSNLEPASNPSPLTTLILGGRTQIEAAREVEPTFASVWLGNNEVLPSAVSGVVEVEELLPPGPFAQRYGATVDELDAMGVEGGVLVGVAHAFFIPWLSIGEVYWILHEDEVLPETFEVADSCGPPEEGGVGFSLVPYDYGILDLLARAFDGQEVTLDCAEDERVLTPRDIGLLFELVELYNQAIFQEAQARGWAFVNPNETLQLIDRAGMIPAFPILNQPEQLFGPIFSLDGIHLGGDGHRLLTNLVIEGIHDVYEIPLDSVDAPDLQSRTGFDWGGEYGVLGEARVPERWRLLETLER